ncbi:hypothetical protein K6H11_004169 [Candida tropicalis]
MFPSKLRYLEVETSANTILGVPRPSFNLTHLKLLEFVKVNSAVKYDWEFPTNIRSISMQGFMDLDDISVNHPRLINFSDRTVTQNILSYGKDNPITFPSRVKKLDLTYGYFATPKAEIEIEPERAAKRRKPNHEEHGWSLNQWPKYQRIKFPESLVELRVDGSAKDLHRTKNVVVIDFRMCELPQLSTIPHII